MIAAKPGTSEQHIDRRADSSVPAGYVVMDQERPGPQYKCQDNGDGTGVWSEDLAAIRALKGGEIKEYALSLMRARIAFLDDFKTVAFLKTIWPTLTDPESQPDLAYCRDVYLHAMDRLDTLATADRETIEGYDPSEDTGWP